ncbi:mechanosensitive ion channel family protein [Sansalvadorimonas sp. 2012CJ34-2]|uniref:Mechanosensitive ion channel family protein n=1 Tax=Parendozoicomonas callyspongiae TaxID=2942213 RepID=A0ABT0PLD3_9GAMM|nr:mechanosensitive ion channel family protein [Sansalvadorimonas sp. 2012CJ34-2]MCL6272056.1 mechanosensitive ion channel family protein [Sansalvadorimonas sp. 2012CJ34-2]
MFATADLAILAPLGLKLVLTLVLFMTASWLCNRTLHRLTEHFTNTRSHWDDTLTRAARPVLTIGLALMGLSVAFSLIADFCSFNDDDVVLLIRRITVILLLYALLIRYLRLVRESLAMPDRARIHLDLPTIELLLKLLQLGLTVATGLTLLQNFGVSISGLLAFGGVGGLAIGLAAKDMLANLFGGLTLYMDRPFVIGDKVNLKDKGIEGFVEKIGWRQTRIRGYDRTPIYVPNALFTNMAVINPSRMQNRRINITIGLRYQDFSVVEAVTMAIESYLSQHPELDQNRGILARFTDYGECSLDILVRFYTLTTDWKTYMGIRHKILLEIGKIIHEHGADMAFPTRTVEIESKDTIDGEFLS